MKQPSSDAATAVYMVEGVTCGHCVAAVREQVSAVPGAAAVAVELQAGRLTVIGGAEPEGVRAAVREAGYEVPS